MASAQYVYLFTQLANVEKLVGTKWDDVKGFLGGKGAGLARMQALGLPVPAGFTISTEACKHFLAANEFPAALWQQVLDGLKAVEAQTGKKFNDEHNPLFVSCRSGAKFSMPGMMDTVLNIGLNDQSAVTLAKLTSERFVYDAYRRLISGFGSIVLNIPSEAFEHALGTYKKSKGYKSDVDMTAEDWKTLIVEFKAITKKEKGIEFPQEPLKQLHMSIGAVFSSWNSKRAIAYREKMNIAHDLGTACSIVMMVFGNMGDDSATGVAFTRNPSTGEKKFYGEYLKNAQGEDVVAGIRNTTPVIEMEKEFPEAYKELLNVAAKLELFFKNMQDIEFTIEKKKLYMLQCRDGKRTAKSQVKIAIDMVNENLITKEEAIKRVTPDDVNILLLPQLDSKELEAAKKEGKQIAKGVNASPGGAVGKVYFEADVAVEKNKAGESVVLVRPFTKPEDVHGFFASKGILTAEGGATSHAAVVARQFGLPCIAGASAINVDLKAKLFTVAVGDKLVTVKEGDYISLDATAGYVYVGKINTVAVDFAKELELKTILEWADEICAQPWRENGTRPGLQVWANADYGRDAIRARAFGAKGIGLCRTEHMFFETERLPLVQKMILSKDPAEKQVYLDKLEPYQRKDFEDLFRSMSGLPVIIRLIDPPLHEFLPDEEKLKQAIHKAELSKAVEMVKPSANHAAEIAKFDHEIAEKTALYKSVELFHEANPMIGLRGCRLGIVYPAIMTMQAKAIFSAAFNVKKEGYEPIAEVMVPLTVNAKELEFIQPLIIKGYEDAAKVAGIELHWKYGTMIETPRAALVADDLAKLAKFFSFGTNDLTQMTFGVSRDDAEKSFLVDYVTKNIIPYNPFQTLDKDGVGLLINKAVQLGRKVNGPTMNIGVCGEVGGDPISIESFHSYNLTYVSCSPFRVPVARLAAAHAALKWGKM